MGRSMRVNSLKAERKVSAPIHIQTAALMKANGKTMKNQVMEFIRAKKQRLSRKS